MRPVTLDALREEIRVLRRQFQEMEISESELAQAEDALRKSEARYQTLAETAPVGIFRTGPDGTLLYANERAFKMAGLGPGDAPGGGWADALHPDDRERVLGGWSRAQREGISHIDTYRFVRSDRSVCWVLAQTVPEWGADGKIHGWVGTLTDITERKEAEERLERSNALLKAEQEASASGVLIVDQSGHISGFNKQFLRLWNIPEEMVRTHKTDNVLLDYVKDQIADWDEFISLVQYLYEHPEEERLGDLIELKSGRLISRNTKPVRLADGQVVARVWDFTDLTDWLRAEKLLQGVAKATDRLLAMKYQEETFPEVLALLGEASRADRAYLFERHRHPETGEDVVSQRHEWCRPGIESQANNPALQSISHKTLELSAWYDAMLKGKPIGGPARDFPKPMRKFLEAQSVRSLLLVPIPVGTDYWGFIGFDDCHGERIWSENTESLLVAMAASIGSAVGRQQTEREIEHRVAFENLVAMISTRFINLAPTDLDDAINQALREVGEFAGVDRSYVFLYSDEGKSMDNTHEWCAEGIRAEMARLQGIPVASLPWFNAFMQHREVMHVPRVSELPPEASAEREEWKAEAIQSLICLPMVCAGELVGFLGFDSVRAPKSWDGNTISLLRIVGEIFANAIQRGRAEEERLALERKMLDAQKLESLGVLAGGIAHDFNNLLMSMLGNASLALMELSPESPGRDLLERIETAARRAGELTRQLLAYSGKGRFVVEAVQINQVIEEMTHLLRVSISKKAALRYDLSSDLPPVEGDATQLRQVIMNLIVNASEALGEEVGNISLTSGVVQADSDYLASAYLAPELPAGEYVYLEISDTGCGMDAETQARLFDPFFTTKFTGRGLGLAAVLGIVRGHGGALKVYSEPGQGTTMKILLPAARGATARAAEGVVDEAPWRGSGTVLVIDDEDGVRATAAGMLRKLGFEVLVASNGRAGIEIFRSQAGAFRCVLLDMTMPELSGPDTFASLRRIDAQVPVLLMSGYNERDAVGRFSGKGLAGFLQKPFAPQELTEKLRKCLPPEE